MMRVSLTRAPPRLGGYHAHSDTLRVSDLGATALPAWRLGQLVL